jgi:hypothetical protein
MDNAERKYAMQIMDEIMQVDLELPKAYEKVKKKQPDIMIVD